jgi:hypothetical protein
VLLQPDARLGANPGLDGHRPVVGVPLIGIEVGHHRIGPVGVRVVARALLQLVLLLAQLSQ